MRTTTPTTSIDWSCRPVACPHEIVGRDAEMVVVCVTGSRSYVRVSSGALGLLRMIDGTRTLAGIVDAAAGRSGRSPAAVEATLAPLLLDLARTELVAGLDLPESRRSRLARGVQLLPRLYLVRRPWPARLSLPLRPLANRVGARLLGLGVAAGCASALVALGALAGALDTGAQPLLPAAVAAILAGVALHELAHASVCAALRVPVREWGVALSFYVLPMVFVDRTDAYRVSRPRRALIALAGPVCDLLLAGAAAVVALACGPGSALGATATAVAGLQLALLIANLLPLAGTDGYQAIEALCGEDNFQGRALGYATHRLLGVRLPTSLTGVSRRRRRAYLAFTLLTWLLLVAWIGGMAAYVGAMA
jgi:putative peptide zinc metalloprotease protein